MVLMPMGLFVFTNSSLLGFHSTRCSLCYAVGVVGVLEVDYDFSMYHNMQEEIHAIPGYQTIPGGIN